MGVAAVATKRKEAEEICEKTTTERNIFPIIIIILISICKMIMLMSKGIDAFWAWSGPRGSGCLPLLVGVWKMNGFKF